MDAQLSATTMWSILALYFCLFLSLTTGNPAYSRDESVSNRASGPLNQGHVSKSELELQLIDASDLVTPDIEDGSTSTSMSGTDDPIPTSRKYNKYNPDIPTFHGGIQKRSISTQDENQNDFGPTITPIPMIKMNHLQKQIGNEEVSYEDNSRERQNEAIKLLNLVDVDKTKEIFQSKASAAMQLKKKSTAYHPLRSSNSLDSGMDW